MRTAVVFLAGIATMLTLTCLAEREAAACGGCFVPPENPTVVSDHRMILSISKDRSTLYDQIRYSGSPASFAWVLPIAGTVEVGLSADVVFGALDGMTQTQIVAPRLNCPAGPTGCPSLCCADGGVSVGGQAEAGVDVLKREVVGPYETVQLAATDPAALNNWLDRNGFSIPTDVQPVVSAYVNEKFNFLALRLVPGKGVQDMRPVRVTTTGASAVLPLRMVAAGTGPVVGISLWVIAEGRYEPQNFPSFVIESSEIAWDWTARKSNYVDLRAKKTAAGNGRAWEIESVTRIHRQTLESRIAASDFGAEPSAYLPVSDAQGNILQTAAQVRAEDVATLFAGIPAPSVTRMRSDLAHAALDQDMAMVASANQALLSNVRQVTKELNQPACPVWNGCEPAGTAPRDEALRRSANNWGAGDAADADADTEGTFGCSTAQTGAPSWMAAGLGFLGLGLIRARRRRHS